MNINARFFSLSPFPAAYSSVTMCLNSSFEIKLGNTEIVYRGMALEKRHDISTVRTFESKNSHVFAIISSCLCCTSSESRTKISYR